MRFVVAVTALLSAISLYAAPLQDTSALHLDWLDKKVDLTKNFFLYANGGWQKQNTIPAAYSRWDNFHILEEQNLQVIHQILIETTKNSYPIGSIEQKVGDFYFSGMNEKAINTAGVTPLQPEFERINQIKKLSDLTNVIAHLHRMGIDVLFGFGQMQDFKNSNQVIGVAAQGGVSLPDRDYYLSADKKFREIRKAYLQHITSMFKLLGNNEKQATHAAKTIMKIETALAKASMSRIKMRNPHAIYHPTKLAELNQATPNFSWAQYFSEIEHPTLNQINLATPEFFKAMNMQLKKVSLEEWKIYLRWHVIDSFAPYLSEPFVRESFKMKVVLTGVKEQLPRWKRVVNAESQALGFAIGKLYVEKKFPVSSKKAVENIINHIRTALQSNLQQANWMDAKTRQAALKKLSLMQARVGYPNKWWDYSALTIDRNSYVLNIMRTSEFITQREWNKIGKPVDKNEWDMTPQTVNAYYDASMNRLNIPAGILQSPLFDPKASEAINYGAIGFVIGHEMTHGFDDEGARFDGAGNLKNWWTENDLKKFQEKTEQIANQFSQYTVNGNVHVQGKLVMGEATADLGGLTLAYHAFHAPDVYREAKIIDGFTPDQQFFLSAAHVWASNMRAEEAHHLVVVDPHPPAMYRVNGTLANMPQFKSAYGIRDGSPMANGHHSAIW